MANSYLFYLYCIHLVSIQDVLQLTGKANVCTRIIILGCIWSVKLTWFLMEILRNE